VRSDEFAGRSGKDSSKNFRINVWDGGLQIFRTAPGWHRPGEQTAFNLIYPLYQTAQKILMALSAYPFPGTGRRGGGCRGCSRTLPCSGAKCPLRA